jgi:hypothetical protein
VSFGHLLDIKGVAFVILLLLIEIGVFHELLGVEDQVGSLASHGLAQTIKRRKVKHGFGITL